MISRQSTTTPDRIRRARSTTSMQAARQRSSATSDPFVLRKQAEAAATQAYRHAKSVEQRAVPDYRPAPAMLHRRRSQVTGRSEGSHLEDARLGRRRSIVRREESKSTPPTRQRPRSEHVPTAKQDETRVRRTTIAQPRPDSATRAAHRQDSRAPATNAYPRDSPFGYSSGSPAPRSSSAVSQARGVSTTYTPRNTDKSYDDGISATYTEPQSYANRTATRPSVHPRRVSIRETQTDEEIVALARDRQLQDSQQHKIRERKSFFGSLQALQRRNPTGSVPVITYDSSLPPSNYADDSLMAPLPPTHDVAPASSHTNAGARTGCKTRAFSSSVKGQFKKLLRKASRAPSVLLAQHNDAKVRGHHAGEDDDSIGLQASSVLTDPFIVPGSPKAAVHSTYVPLFSTLNASDGSGNDGSAADRSRVTSWTNSTAAGTSSTYANTASTSVADEHGRILRNKNDPVLRKKGSFFSRAVQSRLRKVSRADLKGSGDSQALFAALQEHISPHDAADNQADSAISVISRTSSTLATLPSQRQPGSLAPSVHGKSSTIRTVSPNSDAPYMQFMSPVVEASPDNDRINDVNGDRTPTARCSKPKETAIPAQAERPSPERIARRVRQSQARWKGALHTNFIALDSKFSSASDDDNPYELPSLAKNTYAVQEQDTGGLPQHTRVNAQTITTRGKLLSPSLYSRATDGASPHPVTPEHSGTRITVTSREIKEYDISPPKQQAVAAQRSVQASGEWRKWSSDEMNSLSLQDVVNSNAPHDSLAATAAFTVDCSRRNPAVTTGSSSQRQSSETPTSDLASRGRRDSRPRANSRRSSYMNERYPIIESSDNSSRRTSRKCSMASNAGTDTERSLQIPGSDESKRSVSSAVASSRSAVSKVLPKRHSLANLESCSLSKTVSKAAPTVGHVPDEPAMSGAIPDQDPISGSHVNHPSHHKHKSAFGLRAKYRASVTSTSRPVEVRRKSTAPLTAAVFEDNTLQNISAGPYATTSTSNARANKENTPPHVMDDGNLPALSSSEWLAGPTSKKREPKARPKSSPPKSGGPVGNGKEGSPGQRLVTGWLDGRKSKGADREMAFV